MGKAEEGATRAQIRKQVLKKDGKRGSIAAERERQRERERERQRNLLSISLFHESVGCKGDSASGCMCESVQV